MATHTFKLHILDAHNISTSIVVATHLKQLVTETSKANIPRLWRMYQLTQHADYLQSKDAKND